MKILIKFIFCGLLSALLFPPFFIFPVGFIVFPFLFFLLIDKKYLNKKRLFHFYSGLVYGIGFNIVVLFWIKEPFLIEPSTSKFTLLSYLLIVYCSIFYGLSFSILSFFNNYFSKLILLPIFFVLIEILRENLGYGFPWITFSQVHSGNSFTLNLIYYFGTYGLSYFTILIFLFPVSIILLIKKKTTNLYLKIYILVTLVIIVFSLILIFIRLEDQVVKKKHFLDVSIVQLNLSQTEKNINNNAENRLKRINEIIYKNKSDLLIFAENDFPYIITDLKDLNFLANNLNENQSIFIGGTKKENSKFFNTFISIEKNEIKYFNKIKLVPFGEFLPFRNLLFFFDGIVGKNDFSSGTVNRLIKTSYNLIAIPIICYEIIFFNDLLNNDNFNSELLVNITNDSWFGNFSGPYQHFYISRMRAVEFNKPLIRVSNNGISAFINNKGKIIDYIPLNKSSILNSKISIPYSLPNLIKYHSLIIILFFLIFCFVLLINRKKYD